MRSKDLIEWRKAHHHSQQSLADELHLHVRQIIRYEMGDVRIPYPIELALRSVPARDPNKIGRWPKKG